MKTAVIGSMSFRDRQLLFRTLDQFLISLVISGKAPGADEMAAEYANARGIPKDIKNPDWSRYGKRAAFMANIPIVNAAEQVVAFWDGKSKGTKDALDYARKQGKPIYLITGASQQITTVPSQASLFETPLADSQVKKKNRL